MSTITTRSGKGSPLTNTEVDTNFTNLNTDKYQSGDNAAFGSLTLTGNVVLGIDTGVAAAGTTQGTGTALTKTYNIVATGTANEGVVLPDVSTGLKAVVYNSTSAIIKIYPAASESIDDESANVAITLRPNKGREFVGVSATQWNTTDENPEALDITGNASIGGDTSVTGSLVVTGNSTLNGLIAHGVTAAVAAAGSNQAGATVLSETLNVITSGTGGVKLPTALAGRTISIFNTLSTDLSLYPDSSDTINGGSADAAIALPANTTITVSCKDSTDWVKVRPLAVYNSSGTLVN
tara:strand:- start:2122 stop:3003 length:882 start_codon:yes stop_codon:yes gene_type:complete